VAPFFDERTAQHIRPPKRALCHPSFEVRRKFRSSAVRRADGLGQHGSHNQPTGQGGPEKRL